MIYLGFMSRIFLAYISFVHCCHAILPALPNSVRIDSRVTSIAPSSLEVYAVEEYVDIFDGSIRITVLDVTEDSRGTDLNTYYRIKDYSSDQANVSGIDDFLVVFEHEELLCRNTRTDTWQLKVLTRSLENLYRSNTFTTLEIEADRTSLATLALLKIVYTNSQLFVLEREDFMSSFLANAFFFQASFDLSEDNKVVKVICVMLKAHVLNSEQLVNGKSLLSQVDSTAHPILIAMIDHDKDDHEINMLNSMELLNSNNHNLLTVSYFLVQERSTSSHLGVRLGEFSEQNPFSLPSGAGCYAATKGNLLYIGAKQFSGVYKSLDYPNKRYMAYDSVTGHLRFDTVDESKMIYNFRDRKLTFIIDTAHKQPQPSDNHSPRANCAQTSLAGDNENDILQRVGSMENVLGLDENLGVVYLGTTQLEDGTHCLVYEREIGPSQIPFIMKLNLRLSILKNSRFFLVYYFVNELSVRNPDDYRSVWLKRMELSSLTSFCKYKLLTAQVTFSQFAWDLESMVDDSSLSDAELLHPVRTFDTIECQPMRAHTKLEILLKQEIDDAPSDNNTGSISSDLVLDQEFDSLEEALMVRISRLIDFPRSKVNEFELVRMPSEAANQMHYVLATAKLMNPLDVIHSSKLIGWCKNIDEMPFNKYGSYANTEQTVIRPECMLKLATEQQKNVITMVFCPTFGWCAQLDDLESFDYVKKSASGESAPDSNIYPCEMYRISKEVDSLQLMSDRLKRNSLVKALQGRELAADVAGLADDVERSSLFKAKVVKVSVTDVNEAETMGILMRKGQCYRTSSKVKAPDADFKLDIKEIVFDLHHSLFFCHKACQIYPNCHTYSYAAASRTCTLTNIPDNYVQTSQQPRLVDEDILSDLKEDTDCSMYSLNAMYLYHSTPVVLVSRPSALEADKLTDYYITLGSLEICASLCNSNSLNCQIFLYNPLNRVCAIEDKDFLVYKQRTLAKGEIYNEEVKRNNYIRWLGQETWSSALSFHQYSRDYERYYAVEYSRKIDLTESSYTIGQGDEQVTITRPASDSLEEIVTLYDLDSKSCLRECTLIRSDCVMVDYCFQPIKSAPTRCCTMYRVGGKLAAAVQESSEMKDLGKSSLVMATGCFHYRLNEEFLLLKRLTSGYSIEMGKEIAKEDSEKSSHYLESITKINNNQPAPSRFDEFSIVGDLLLLALGLYVGISMSHRDSQLSFLDVGSKLKAKFNSAYEWLRLKRKLERSQSRQELNEMEDFS